MRSLNWWPRWLKGGWAMSKIAQRSCHMCSVTAGVKVAVDQFVGLQYEHKQA